MKLPRIVVSEGVAPDEVVMIGAFNGARWTPDEGVQELSPYQMAEVRKLIVRGWRERCAEAIRRWREGR